MVHNFHLLTVPSIYSNFVSMLGTKNSWQSINDTTLLAQLAIQAALSANWKDAIEINEKIFKLDTSDAEALNRLAHAYTCLGKKERAKNIYQKVLEIDPYNIIASKNMDKISKMNGQSSLGKTTLPAINLANVFLYEPGKTKVINLLNLAPPSILANLNCGDKVLLKTKKHSVTISACDGTYLGALPDDLAHRLIGFIDGGNVYDVFVKFATTKNLTVFIREVHRDSKFASQPTFTEGQKYFFEEKVLLS